MNQQERNDKIRRDQEAAAQGSSLRPAPSDPAYRRWAGENKVGKRDDPHWEKARQRGEVK